MSLSVSLIVTTYNWPGALDRVLAALCAQRYTPLEIIVADDGSTDNTAQVVRSWQQQNAYIRHCWQNDQGFRAAMIRNRAVAQAQNEYIIFLDGDCIPFPDFVYQHARLAEKGYWVAGNRLLLNEALSKEIIEKKELVHHWSRWRFARGWLRGQCNRVSTLFPLPLGNLRKLFPHQWQGAKTCNLGLWRRDFIAVNGFDEEFQGWGFEDSDLVVRLQKNQIYRKSGKWALPVVHLWHPLQERGSNQARFLHSMQSAELRAVQGLDQYL